MAMPLNAMHVLDLAQMREVKHMRPFTWRLIQALAQLNTFCNCLNVCV